MPANLSLGEFAGTAHSQPLWATKKLKSDNANLYINFNIIWSKFDY